MSVAIPKDGQIMCLMVDQKDDMPYLWVSVPCESKSPVHGIQDNIYFDNRTFEVFTTNEPIPVDERKGYVSNYIGSFQIHRGEFIGHVFELVKK